jgi:competence protein ComEC
MLKVGATGFVTGIALGSLFNFDIWELFATFVFSLVCFAVYYLNNEEIKEKLLYVAIFILFVTLGVGRVYVSNLYSESELSSFINKKVIVEGVVVAEPDVREKNTKLTIKVEKVFYNQETITASGEKILATVPLYPEYNYGDRLRLNVSLEEPKEIESADGRTFDYGGYLRVRGIWYTSRFATAELLSSGNGNAIKTMLFKTKHVFTNSINQVLPEPQSSLLGGLLLGSKQSLGKDLLTDFQRTGVSHIVVLSGYNIAIVAESIINIFKFLPKNISFGFGALGIILFTMLSGGGASGVRASIMVLVALFAKHSNRDYKAGRILGFTIILMLTPNPLLLVFDPSFQLSILATIGIIFVSPIIEPYLKSVTEKFGLREILSTTVATQITVLPFLIYNTGLLSIVSLPVNVLILGTIPVTMFLGFITGVFGLVSIYLAFIPAFFTYLLLLYQLKIVDIGSSISFGAVTLPAFSPILLIIIYFGISFGLLKLKKRLI